MFSWQALADIAVFRDMIFAQYNLPVNTQVVTFGGSYAGAMSAFFRTKYPQLVNAAVATSGPVNAVVDFYQYQDVVQNSLSTANQVRRNDLVIPWMSFLMKRLPLKGAQCVANIQSATNQIQQLLQSASGRQQLVLRM